MSGRKNCSASVSFWLFISISSCPLLLPLLHAHLSPSPVSIISHHRHHKHAPKAFASEMHFMQKLFQQFEHGHGIGSGAIGYVPNVAVKKCAVPAKNSKAKGKFLGPGLQFELEKMVPTERYIEAELHVRGRLTSGTSLQIVQFLCASPEGAATAWPERRLTLHLPRVQVERVRGTPGWAVYDAMTLMMFREMGEPGELGELFINFKRDGKLLGEQELKQFIRTHRPFLVLYTDSKTSMPKFHAQEKTVMREKREARATLTNYVRDDEHVQQHMDSVRKTAEYYSYGMAKGQNHAGGGIPMDKGGEKTFRMLSRRRKQKSRKGTTRRASSAPRYPGFDPNDPMLGFGTPYSPWQRAPYGKGRLLQSPNYGNSLNDIRALREHAYRTTTTAVDKSKESVGNAEDGNDETKLVLMAKEEDETGKPKAKCALHNMTVDFRQLGWSDRIIAPKSFEAGFCAGQCHHPLEQDTNPSNHAILQSLMVAQQQDQVVQQQQQIPTVCCAPDSFDSLTLLYFDERDNVVLKSYPRMVALSCGCL